MAEKYETPDDKKITRIKTEILIIGTGGAGLTTAIRLYENGKKDILLVGDCKFRHAHTEVAEGGVNAAFGNMDNEPDTPLVHAADTFLEGHKISNPQMVETLAQNAPNAIKRLVELGADFHKEADGKISQRYFGAHTYRRTIFKGDETGAEIMRVLCNRTEKDKIPHREGVYIFKLLIEEGKVVGALGIDKDEIIAFEAPVVVLATGGYANLFERSTQRPTEGFGEGIAMAFEEGAVIGDMEMVQFHPTGLLFPKEKAGELVTEAVRGEGGILKNKLGERFMERYSPEKKELSTRDVVARSNYMEITNGRGTERGGVYLDISGRDKKFYLEKLPKMYNMLKKYNNIDIAKEPMEVAPTAHYTMGGIQVDPKTCETSIKNLYAIGECTMGVHGANRLGGNSLAEILVFGDILANELLKKKRKTQAIDSVKISAKVLKGLKSNPNGVKPEYVIEKIRTILWIHAGIARNEKQIKQGLTEIEAVRKTVEEKGIKTGRTQMENMIYVTRAYGMLDLAVAILEGALFRKESRGAHYREDYIKKDDKNYLMNILFQKKTNKITKKLQKIKNPSSKLQKVLKSFQKTQNYGHVE